MSGSIHNVLTLMAEAISDLSHTVKIINDDVREIRRIVEKKEIDNGGSKSDMAEAINVSTDTPYDYLNNDSIYDRIRNAHIKHGYSDTRQSDNSDNSDNTSSRSSTTLPIIEH